MLRSGFCWLSAVLDVFPMLLDGRSGHADVTMKTKLTQKTLTATYPGDRLVRRRVRRPNAS